MTNDHVLLLENFHSTGTLLSYPEQEEIRFVEGGNGLPQYAGIEEILGTRERSFLLLVRVDSTYMVLLYKPVDNSYQILAETGRSLDHAFSWNQFQVFTVPGTNLLVLFDGNNDTLTEHTVQGSGSDYTIPDAEGYFWELSASSIDGEKAMYQYRLTGSGIQPTGATDNLLKGDLAEALRDDPSIVKTAVRTIALNGFLYDVETGMVTGFYDGFLNDLDEGFLMTSDEWGTEFQVRSWDGQNARVIHSDYIHPAGFAETGSLYHIFYNVMIDGAWRRLELTIPRGVPAGHSGLSLGPQFPISPHYPWAVETFFPVDDSRFGYYRMEQGGTSLVIVDAVNKSFSTSVHIGQVIRSNPPTYDPDVDAFWYGGYLLNPDASRSFSSRWMFDANPETQVKVEDQIFHTSTVNRVYNIGTGQVQASEHGNFGPLLIGKSGKIYHFSNGGGYFDNPESFRLGTDNSLPWTPPEYDNFKSNEVGDFFASDRGDLVLNEDFQNLIHIDPWFAEDRFASDNYALSADKYFKLIKVFDGAFPPGYRHYLRIWNKDGSKFRQYEIPWDLINPIAPENLKYALVGSHDEVYLMAVVGVSEVLVFDIDEETGELQGLDDVMGQRLDYFGWYQSFFLGMVHDTGDFWKYVLGKGWTFLHENDKDVLYYDPDFGFVSAPKYSRNVIYTYSEGWKGYLYEADGLKWYWDYKYKWKESNYPSLAPVTLEGRRFEVYTNDPQPIEYWEFQSSDYANIVLYYEEGTVEMQSWIRYEGPTGPGDKTVRIVMTDNELGVTGYYEMTFVDKWSGHLHSNLNYPDPNRPGQMSNIQADGTFKMVPPRY